MGGNETKTYSPLGSTSTPNLTDEQRTRLEKMYAAAGKFTDMKEVFEKIGDNLRQEIHKEIAKVGTSMDTLSSGQKMRLHFLFGQLDTVEICAAQLANCVTSIALNKNYENFVEAMNLDSTVFTVDKAAKETNFETSIQKIEETFRSMKLENNPANLPHNSTSTATINDEELADLERRIIALKAPLTPAAKRRETQSAKSLIIEQE